MLFFSDLISVLTFCLGTAIWLCTVLELIEIIDLLLRWRRTVEEATSPAFLDSDDRQPLVSLHVPICCEPVCVVETTLRALATMQYRNFEVVVVCNNTEDRSLWEPVSRICAGLGPRFKFHFVLRLSGYKAGALNFALRQTSDEADFVGLVDADYVVDANYLSEIVPFFRDERVAFVQTPQDYQSARMNWFAASCYWEYWQFFEVGMPLRALRKAPMLHGTMSVIRKQALLQAGGWAEWCITEDSELGLRLLSLGHRALYLKRTYGRGLLPFSFADYKRQRWRWAAGGAQQLRRHLRLLITNGHLTLVQKAHHIQGWIPWLRDALIAASLPLLGATAIQFIALPGRSVVPLYALGSGVLGVILHQAVRHLIIYRTRLRLPWPHVIGASLAITSLTSTIGVAWILAMIGRRSPFKITPKVPDSNAGRACDLKLEIGCALYLAAVTVVLLKMHDTIGYAPAVVPILYILLLVPACAMSLASWRSLSSFERSSRGQQIQA